MGVTAGILPWRLEIGFPQILINKVLNLLSISCLLSVQGVWLWGVIRRLLDLGLFDLMIVLKVYTVVNCHRPALGHPSSQQFSPPILNPRQLLIYVLSVFLVLLF